MLQIIISVITDSIPVILSTDLSYRPVGLLFQVNILLTLNENTHTRCPIKLRRCGSIEQIVVSVE